MSGMQTLMNFFLGNVRPSAQDTVIEVKRTVLAVAWLAINQSVRGATCTARTFQHIAHLGLARPSGGCSAASSPTFLARPGLGQTDARPETG